MRLGFSLLSAVYFELNHKSMNLHGKTDGTCVNSKMSQKQWFLTAKYNPLGSSTI